RFYFMCSFDYCSSPFQKNPFGVIEAFQKAFPAGEEGVGLVIKSTGAPEHYPDVEWAIRKAGHDDSRIMIFDDKLSHEQVIGLICASDAYTSLHRSEGFGFGMAEALRFGRIVIATDYSGPTDFLNEQTGYPVPYFLRPLLPHEHALLEGQCWAEPDVAAAAEIMRHVVASPEEGRRRGEAGRSRIVQRYGATSVGRSIHTCLAEIRYHL